MPLDIHSNPSDPRIHWTARCDRPDCLTAAYADAVHPHHVVPPLVTQEQVLTYVNGMAAKRDFAHRDGDGGFLCATCHRVSRRKDRPSWDEYFMAIATAAATRSTCDRKHVGCVIVRDRNITATGYNGSISGLDDCDTNGHLLEDNHCVRTVHAETNAVAQAAKNGQRIDGASVYITAFPCWNCCKMLLNAGIVRIAYAEAYRPDPKVVEACGKKNINLVEILPR